MNLVDVSKVDKPYFPSGGVNVDANGLMMSSEECVMSSNFDILSDSVRLRDGSINLTPSAGASPTEDVLHIAEFKHPSGSVALFAFTSADIYEYDAAAGWVTCLDTGVFGGNTFNHWSTTQIVDEDKGTILIAAGSTIVANHAEMVKGDERVLLYYDFATSLFKTYSLLTQELVTEEATGLSYPAADAAKLSWQGMALSVIDTSKWATHSTTEIKVAMVSEKGGSAAPTVSIVMLDEDGDSTDVLEEAVEAEITLKGTTATTSASMKTALSGDALASRILSVDDYSFDIKLTQQVATYFETSVSGVVTGSKLDANATDTTGFDSLVKGTFYISLGTGEGVVAYAGKQIHSLPVGKTSLGDASDGASVDCYRLLPTNYEVASYDTDSYVRVDGLEWQIKILLPIYAGAALLVTYDYYVTSGYKPVYITTHRNVLLMANMYEDSTYYPWRLRWSNVGDVSKVYFADFQDFMQGKLSPIVGMKTLNTVINDNVAGFLYVFQTDYINRGVPSGDAFLIFDMAYAEGVLAPRTIVEADGLFYFMAHNDIVVFDGIKRRSLTRREGGQTRVRNYIYDNIDYNDVDKNFSIYDVSRRKIWFFLKMRGSSTYPATVAVYSIDSGIWYFYNVPETSCAINMKFVSEGTPIDALEGNIEDLTGNIEDLNVSIPYTDRVLAAMTKDIFSYAGGATKDKLTGSSGTDIEAYLLTRDFVGEMLEAQDRFQHVALEAKGQQLSVSWNGNYSLEPSDFLDEEVLSTGPTYELVRYNPDVTHYHIRFMLSVISTAIEFRWLQVYGVQQELRND